MASVSIEKICKSFKATQVLRDVSIDVEDGAFVALVGPSGCGKSTLLRTIAGLEKASSGEIRIGGKTVNNVPPHARDIAMVFQSYALYPHMTVRENMSFGLQLKRTSQPEIDAKVGRAAEILSLGPLLDRLPAQLSGGQRQRVAMGRAIVRDPQVFLFDEPLSNLDAKLRIAMRSEIKALHRRLGTTMIYVTHDQIEAMTMADKIVVMQGGTVEQSGHPLDLYDRPKNPFVATFIGVPSMNLFKGIVQKGALLTDARQVLPLPLSASIQDGQELVYGVRPEDWRLADEGIPATVVLVEPTGSETQIMVRIGEVNYVCLHRGRDLPALDQAVHLSIDPALTHVFDAASERRLG